MVATFVVMLLLLPFDSTRLPVSLPIEATLDRVAILVIGVVWIVMLGARLRTGPAWPPMGLLGVGMVALVTVGSLSILADLTTLEYAGELQVAIKRLALLASYGLFLVLVATSIRPADVRGLVRLMIIVGCACALGVIYEYRADSNVFFDLTRSVVGGVLDVQPEPAPEFEFSRRVITGPARHGLAVTAMLAIIAPFALAYTIQARELRVRVLYGAAFGILVIGAMSTLRRTSVIAPLAIVAVFLAYRPRQSLRLAPYALPGVALLHALSPGAAGSLLGLLTGGNTLAAASNAGRSDDYVAVHLDILHRPLLGRGYGAYQPEHYRILDNQFLLLLIEVGVVGLACFALILAGAWLHAHRLQRMRHSWQGEFGLGALAATAVFGLVSAIFDTLSFPQPSYAFIFVAGLATVILADASSAPAPRTASGGPVLQALSGAESAVSAAAPAPAPRPLARAGRGRAGSRWILAGLALLLLVRGTRARARRRRG